MKILIGIFFTLINLIGNDIKDIQTYKANFKQIITNQSNKDIVYNGEIFLKNPNLILWVYNEPIIKYVYINNKTVSIIEPELEQAIITNLSQEIDIFKLLKESKQISKNLYENSVNNINYSIEFQDNILKKISYKDEIDNNINITFNDIKQNIDINNSKFKYNIPYDFDIIRK